MNFWLSFNIACSLLLVHTCGAPVVAFLVNSGIYTRDRNFDDLLPTSVNQWFPADSDLQCGRQCQEETWCNSFFYNRSNGTCALQRMVYVSLQSSQMSTAYGWKYYRLVSASCPAKSDYVIDRVTATCYRLVTSHLTWSAARAACAVREEMLVVLEPVEKASFVHDFLNTNIALHNFSRSVFIGGSRPLEEWDTPIPPEGLNFVWLNGQPVDLNATQAFWYSLPGSPWDYPSQHVIKMRRNCRFLWTLSSAYDGKFSICERLYV